MRGFDYRAPKNGIELLIAANFPNLRAYEEVLGCAGRNDDRCQRFVLHGLNPID